MIDTKALRSKVLDLAIQGKLTQQLESDGTAEELFSQIQEEKQMLIKDGKIKKEKPLPPVSDEEIPFDIPSNWVWARWGNLSESIQYGYNAPATDSGRIKMVRITDIQNNQVIWENIPYCEIDDDLIEGYKLANNDILFARTGGTVGKSFIVTNINEDAVFAGYLIRTRYSSNLSGQYLKMFMESELYWKQLRFGTTSTAQPNCNATTLSRMCIPLPPLAEQKRIVERVEEIFKLLDIIDEAQKKYSADAEILKSKLITMGIQGKLTKQLDSDGTAEELYQQIQEEKQKLIKEGKIKKEKALQPVADEEIPFEIPSNWRWCRLGNLSSLITKGSSPKWQGVNYTDEENGILFVTSEKVGKNKMLLEKRKYIEKHFNDSHQSSIIQKGDILTNIVGASIGRTAIFNENIENANINQAVCVVRLIENRMSNYVLRYMNGYDAISLMLGKTVDTAQANLILKSVSNLIIPLPPLAEQKRIADTLDEVLRAIG